MTASPDEEVVPGAVAAPGRPPYNVAYTVSVEGLVDAARLAHSGTRNRILLLAAAAAVVGLVFLVLAPTGSGLLLVFFGVAMTLLLVLRAPERWYVGRRAGSVVGTPVRLVVDDAGIEATTPAATGRLAWSGLTEVQADDRAVVFLGGRVLASWAPADAFGPPERREEIVAFARARIAAARQAG
jgi:type IV secretory pathway TrbD component